MGTPVKSLIIRVNSIKWGTLVLPIYALSFLGLINIRLDSFFFGILNGIFELVLFGILLFNLRRIHKGVLLISFLSLSYIIFSLAYSVVFQNDHPLDFLLVYKAFFYVFALPYLVGKDFITPVQLKGFFRVLLFLFFLAYSTDLILGGHRLVKGRPSLIGENNYELMFLCLIMYLRYIRTGDLSKWEVILMVLIFILSTSRSGIVLLLFSLFFIYFKRFTLKTVFMGGLFIIISTGLILAVFIIRIERSAYEEDLESMDRVRMFIGFAKEVSDWGALDYLFGMPPITGMSTNVCEDGVFSYTLQNHSHKSEGSCYSVVLHSFILRAIYDHGIVGLLFIIYSIYKFLLMSYCSRKEAFVIIGIIILNSLSVSGFNSIYASLALAFIVLTEPFAKPRDNSNFDVKPKKQ